MKEDKKIFIVELTENLHVLIEAESEEQAKEDAINFKGMHDIDKSKVVVQEIGLAIAVNEGRS